PSRFADVFEVVREAITHFDPAIGEIVAEAVDANHKFMPIHVCNRPYFPITAHLEAKFDPNDLRSLKRHGFGAIAVPMAIDEKGRRAGTRERINAAKATGQLEVRLHCHVTDLVFVEDDALAVGGVRSLPG